MNCYGCPSSLFCSTFCLQQESTKSISVPTCRKPEEVGATPSNKKESLEPLVVDQQEYNEGAGPIYVSYREVKGAPSSSTKYSRKLTYVKYFYLIDVHGTETLAAIGEDQGVTCLLAGNRFSCCIDNHKLLGLLLSYFVHARVVIFEPCKQSLTSGVKASPSCLRNFPWRQTRT